MKHFHLLMVALTLGLFLYQAIVVFVGEKANPSPMLRRAMHVCYALLLVSGLYMFTVWYQFMAPWAWAKLVLFIVAVSATAKAARPSTTPAQAKFGMLLATIAYVAILVLAVKKPLGLL
ncbi:hypothetical protein B0181_08085 [Moraxella caviae]|uniref:Invasion gene expression up-regulator, SirB n=1 Tax=Moraxella caviae TaxID=34060 RepID=A0A1S9ZYB1_9GAMM|nr:SirB2 family protein [Moraxella caviae]OOR88504.1 hypothetical protein B0181_08085 [Moraxella caviae]STZ14914.1 Invasion gene expression up-regulator, SirB [Moraxella caviae]VEW12720.1 Invasion gene expression up-regulator, SirB [Moraxella caviae]